MTIDRKLQESIVNVPPIGPIAAHPDVNEWFISEPHQIKCLLGHVVQFVFDGYIDDDRKADYHRALQNLIDLDSSVLAAVEPYVTQYCNETLDLYDDQDRPHVSIQQPSDVWKYVQFGTEVHISRRAHGDDEDGIYFSLECNCDWEPEHGLVLVLRDGLEVTKVGPYDGHLTNSDAYADPNLKNVIFKSFCA
ncbi:DUF6985 domain-containing protein [Telluria antibiotica]|nr:hypothetical protein [Telluria antibiotica]